MLLFFECVAGAGVRSGVRFPALGVDDLGVGVVPNVFTGVVMFVSTEAAIFFFSPPQRLANFSLNYLTAQDGRY